MTYEITEEYLSEQIQSLSKKLLKKYAKNALAILTSEEVTTLYNLKESNTNLISFKDSVQNLGIPLTSQDCSIVWFHN